MPDESLSETQLTTAVGELLIQGGYSEVSTERIELLQSDRARVYEDLYTIVSVVVFPTWTELARRWAEVQADYVGLLSKYLGRSDAKAWDAYLVLLTPSMALEQWHEAEEIRRDITRVRKLVGTGEDLRSMGDIATLVSSLLPIQSPNAVAGNAHSVWSLVYQTLQRNSVQQNVVEALVTAYEDQRNVMEALRGTLRK